MKEGNEVGGGGGYLFLLIKNSLVFPCSQLFDP